MYTVQAHANLKIVDGHDVPPEDWLLERGPQVELHELGEAVEDLFDLSMARPNFLDYVRNGYS